MAEMEAETGMSADQIREAYASAEVDVPSDDSRTEEDELEDPAPEAACT